MSVDLPSDDADTTTSIKVHKKKRVWTEEYAVIQGKVAAVTSVAEENLKLSIGNAGALKEMEEKSKTLEDNAHEFSKIATIKKNEKWYIACKYFIYLWLLIAVIFLIFGFIIYSYIKDADIDYHEYHRHQYNDDSMQSYWPF